MTYDYDQNVGVHPFVPFLGHQTAQPPARWKMWSFEWIADTRNGCLSSRPFYNRIKSITEKCAVHGWVCLYWAPIEKTRYTPQMCVFLSPDGEYSAEQRAEGEVTISKRPNRDLTPSASHSTYIFSAVWRWPIHLYKINSFSFVQRWRDSSSTDDDVCVLLCRISLCKKKDFMVLKVPAFYQWLILSCGLLKWYKFK